MATSSPPQLQPPPPPTHHSSSIAFLPRVSAFPILPEGHLLYKVSDAINFPAKERLGSPLIGQLAPEIILRDQLDRDCSLRATIALGRPIVLYFFPLAGSPHCTKQSCSFRDALMGSATFTEQDVIVIGVSQDSPDLLKRFINKHDLNFIVLSDEKREAFDTYGVTTRLFGLLNSRCTFIIDPSGVIRGMCEGVLAAQGHMNFAERWLQRIEDEMWHRSKEFSSQGMVKSVSVEEVTKASGRRSKWPSLDRDSRSAADLAGIRARVQSTGSCGSRDGHQDTSAARDRLISRGPLEGGQGNHSSNSLPHGSTAKSGTRRSLRRTFFRSRDAPAPLPPTYENLDSGLQDFGEVEDVPLANEGEGQSHDSMSQTDGGHHIGHWPATQVMSSQGGDGAPLSPAPLDKVGYGPRSRNGSGASNDPEGGARKHAGSTMVEEDFNFVPIPSAVQAPSTSSKSHATSRLTSAVKRAGSNGSLSGPVSRGMHPAARSVAKSPDLEEVEEDRESEAAVRRIAEGAVDLTPKRTLQSLPSAPAVSNVTFAMAGPIPQAPRRTTSRIQHPPSVLNGTSPIRPSSKNSLDSVVEAVRHQGKFSTSPIPPLSFDPISGAEPSEGSLAPRPPTMRTAPARSQPLQFTKRRVVTPGGQDDDDDDEDDDENEIGEKGNDSEDATASVSGVNGQEIEHDSDMSLSGAMHVHAAQQRRSHSMSNGRGQLGSGSGNGGDLRSTTSTPTGGSLGSQALTPTGSLLGTNHGPPKVGDPESETADVSTASSPASSSGLTTDQRQNSTTGVRGSSSGMGRSTDHLSISSSSLASDLDYRAQRRPSGASGASSFSQTSAGTFGNAD